jgi:hypothetical protein
VTQSVSSGLMAFPIDVAHPFRYPSELKRLVDGVRQAGEYDETRWIEWKSWLDLTDAAGIRHIAKQVLGFSNRDPQIAATWATGYAYIVVGASPGELKGIRPVDPERLTSQILPYVGGEIGWTPEYVTVEGQDVLVVVVDPPKPGDKIHALRKDLDRYRAGTVFIRRPGQVAQAGADELDMLQRRLLARGARISLGVEPARLTIETKPDFVGFLNDWMQKERSRLLSLATDPSHASNTRAPRGSVRLAPWAESYINAYGERLDGYFKDAWDLQAQRCLWRVFRYDPTKLGLVIVNSSDRNYAQVRVTLKIKGQPVTAFHADRIDLIRGKEPKVPPPPQPGYGQSSALSSDLIRVFPGFGPKVSASALPETPILTEYGWEAHESDQELSIAFEPRDVRPNQTVPLRAVPLLITAPPPSTISVDWAATATNVDGEARGTCAIAVTESEFIGDWMFSGA